MELTNVYKPIDTESKFDHKNFGQSFAIRKNLESTLEAITKDSSSPQALMSAGDLIWGNVDFYNNLPDNARLARGDLSYWNMAGEKNLESYTVKNGQDLYNTLNFQEKENLTLGSRLLGIDKTEVKNDKGEVDEKKTQANTNYNAFVEAGNNVYDIKKITEIEEKDKAHLAQVGFIQKNSNMSNEWAQFMLMRINNDAYVSQVFREYNIQAQMDLGKTISDKEGKIDESKFGKFMDTNFGLQLAKPSKDFVNNLQAQGYNSYFRIESEKAKK